MVMVRRKKGDLVLSLYYGLNLEEGFLPTLSLYQFKGNKMEFTLSELVGMHNKSCEIKHKR